MSAVPVPDPDLEQNKTIQLLEGELPSPINPPSGCVFRTRCPLAGPECAKTRPLLEGSFRHAVSCLKVDPVIIVRAGNVPALFYTRLQRGGY
ncbi:oligopeptide ABC transporter ATP-binding protein OppF [Kluyvera cryocrescens]|uniref:Oligopeptide ABC transporter ATP-binding protein OppF n=1 Tax=Kluyvera cryocrescens TaxID=580 RepID=A0A485C075_KLUCR|nr:oligopeptide ABC transporter ATP-binding protein OppF [Kluyvera cryocrescens]